jgi:UDP-glucose 4-epimerase
MADSSLLNQIFEEHPEITHTIHCAALVSVPESVEKPYNYYKENVFKSAELFQHLLRLNCKRIVFSSSASIYSTKFDFMVTEASPLQPLSPYAKTKFMVETLLEDFSIAYSGFQAIALRYFNPIGADPLMRSGYYKKENTNVIEKLIETAQNKAPQFCIAGVDWPTRDGSGMRDYVHVWDLARAHIKAIEKFDALFSTSEERNFIPINLGTGSGVTVKELLHAFEKVFGKKLPQKETKARPGDIAGAYASTKKAFELLEWKAQMSLEKGIQDALTWAQKSKK